MRKTCILLTHTVTDSKVGRPTTVKPLIGSESFLLCVSALCWNLSTTLLFVDIFSIAAFASWWLQLNKWRRFFENIEAVVNRNAREANLGGVPTALNKIRAYIRVRDVRKDLKPDELELQKIDDSEPMWAVVYFLLRCGLVQDAAGYVREHAQTFRAVERNFAAYMSGYASDKERRLPRNLQDRIGSEYQQKSRMAPEHSLDPYKMACYKVVGRCELSKRTIENINQSSNDWLWLQFCLAREVNRVDEVAGDVFGLEEVRESISEIGQRHYQKGQEGLGGHGTYFHLLILAGMFEQAISFLYSYSYISAVHFAIGLCYYGLLRVSDHAGSENDLSKSEQATFRYSSPSSC